MASVAFIFVLFLVFVFFFVFSLSWPAVASIVGGSSVCCFHLPPSSSVCCSHLPPSSCWRALSGEESPAKFSTETKCSTPTQCTHLYLACNNVTQSTASSSAVLNITQQWESHAAVCVRCSSSSSSGEVAVHNVRWAVGSSRCTSSSRLGQ